MQYLLKGMFKLKLSLRMNAAKREKSSSYVKVHRTVKAFSLTHFSQQNLNPKWN